MLIRAISFGLISFAGVSLASQAKAQVECGARYDSSDSPVIMTEDISCAGGSYDNAIVLDGPVRLEMDGYRLTCAAPGVNGIRAIGSGVKIIGPGQIYDCEDAVRLSEDGSHVVKEVKINRADNGVASFSAGNKVQLSTIQNIQNNGVWLLSDAQASKIIDNTIKRIGKNGVAIASSARDRASSTKIAGNKIVDVGETGIEAAPDVRVFDNTIKRLGEGGISIRARPGGEVNAGARIDENTIMEAGEHGIHLYGDTFEAIVLNNDVIESRESGIYVELGSDENQISGNDVSGSLGVDMVDENPKCGDNTWVDNSYDTTNASCIR